MQSENEKLFKKEKNNCVLFKRRK